MLLFCQKGIISYEPESFVFIFAAYSGCVRRSSDQKGRIVIESHTEWEFHGNAIDPDAHLNYDTASCYNPRMEGDRFILEVVLKKQ